ncbi:MAG: DUF4445 domain-containing protein [Clostridia bacterium]|nr:DUF4445 domain-containing protein [Clostridia bacterium]
MSDVVVTFLPDNVAVTVKSGTNLFEAATLAGIELQSSCGHKGTCGRCVVEVKEGKVQAKEGGRLSKKGGKPGQVLACQAIVTETVTVEIPSDSRLTEHQVLLANREEKAILEEKPLELEGYAFQPLSIKVFLELEPPTILGAADDLSRLRSALKPYGFTDVSIDTRVLRQLGEVLRSSNWQVTLTINRLEDRAEIIAVEPGDQSRRSYGIALDIGTTTVVAYLVDLLTGKTIDRQGGYNRQSRYGDDVISRIIYANSNPNGLSDLSGAVTETVNRLLGKLCDRNRIRPEEIGILVSAGNTTMGHLFYGINPKYIRFEPYVPTVTDYPVVKAQELGININPAGWIVSLPAVASYVGGDIVSGVLVTGVARQHALTLFIDIGTNGEIVLGNNEWLMACACSAGPAFEGGGITFGMRAMDGAIERVKINPDTHEVQVETIGSKKPMGICGSGLIDLIAQMRELDIIDRTGKFSELDGHPRLRRENGEAEFVLVWGKDTECKKDIVVTESDLKTLIYSKGAVFAGILSLVKQVGVSLEDIEKVIIAGGFGNYLNIRDAVAIGLLPDLPPERYEFVGNSSVKGAKLALLSEPAFKEAKALGRSITYVELSSGNLFMNEFISALFLPHTNLELFPSLAS